MGRDRNDGDDEKTKTIEGDGGITVVIETPALGGSLSSSGGGGGISPEPDHGGGGGGVGESTVTVTVPEGTTSVELPGTETTVVEETPASDELESVFAQPLGFTDAVISGIPVPPIVSGKKSEDGVSLSFTLNCPGHQGNIVGLPHTFLLAPRNTGSCPCGIYLASMNFAGQIIGEIVKIRRNHPLPVYEIEPGAIMIVVGCAGNCHVQGCSAGLPYDIQGFG